MKHSFDLDNFESFLAEQANRHRMYAKESVWHRIQDALHGKGRWPALTFATLLTVTIFAIILTITYPERQALRYERPDTAGHLALSFEKKSTISTSGKPEKNLKELPLTVSNFEASQSKPLPLVISVGNPTETTTILPFNDALNVEAAHSDLSSPATMMADPSISEAETVVLVQETTTEQGSFEIEYDFRNADLGRNANISPVSFSAGSAISTNRFMGSENPGANQIREFTFNGAPSSMGSKTTLKPLKPKSRWSMEIYATPSISYRYLLEDKTYVEDPNSINGPLAPYLTNSVNEFVRHKPKMGMEIGATAIYQLADNLRIKGGLQVNYRQYGIEAYATRIAQPALLTLNNGQRIDSIVQYSSLSTQAGNRPIEVSSNFMQLALPIGFDLKVAGTKAIDFYVGSTGQLTYQVSSSNYILSSDFKNYLNLPELDRKLNFNTAVEAFASFKAGGMNWQAGPQIRYQMFSGTKSAYPIREHLIDYGFKIGMVKTFR